MEYNTVADIYTAHEKVRRGFLDITGGIADDEAAVVPEGEKWSVRHVAEHVAMVESSMARICKKLIEAARTEGTRSDGSVKMSPDFEAISATIADRKFAAPEIVEPTGNVSISDSLAALAKTTSMIDGMRPDLETLDLSGHAFRHPHFGELTAIDWLILRNGHEHRHTGQIMKLLDAIRD